MSEVLIPIVVVPVIFFSFYLIIKTVSDNGVRRKIIDKGLLDENVKHLFQQTTIGFRPNSLKWGMVLVAIGSAVLIGQAVPYSFQEEATISAMFILSGVALVAFYFLAGKVAKDDDSTEPQEPQL